MKNDRAGQGKSPVEKQKIIALIIVAILVMIGFTLFALKATDHRVELRRALERRDNIRLEQLLKDHPKLVNARMNLNAACAASTMTWSAASSRRFWQATCRRRKGECVKLFEPLNAALLGRQVGQAAKAVTSHRTPNLCRPGVDFHHNSTDKGRET